MCIWPQRPSRGKKTKIGLPSGATVGKASADLLASRRIASKATRFAAKSRSIMYCLFLFDVNPLLHFPYFSVLHMRRVICLTSHTCGSGYVVGIVLSPYYLPYCVGVPLFKCARSHARTSIYMHACPHSHGSSRARLHARTHSHTHARMHIRIRTHTHTNTHSLAQSINHSLTHSLTPTHIQAKRGPLCGPPRPASHPRPCLS